MTEMMEHTDELEMARAERSRAVGDAGRLRRELAAVLIDVGVSNQHLDDARQIRDGLKGENRDLRARLEALALAAVAAAESAFPLPGSEPLGPVEVLAEDAEVVDEGDAEMTEPPTQAERQVRIANRALRTALDDMLWITAQIDAPPSIAGRAQAAVERLTRTVELVRNA